jgi:hypothetical protein
MHCFNDFAILKTFNAIFIALKYHPTILLHCQLKRYSIIIIFPYAKLNLF